MSISNEPPVRFDRQKLIVAPPWDSVISDAMRPGLELPTLNSLNCKQAKNCVYKKTSFARDTKFFREIY